MLAEITTTLVHVMRVLALCTVLWGVCLLLGAVLSMRGPEAYFKGGVLIFIGNWIGHLAA